MEIIELLGLLIIYAVSILYHNMNGKRLECTCRNQMLSINGEINVCTL